MSNQSDRGKSPHRSSSLFILGGGELAMALSRLSEFLRLPCGGGDMEGGSLSPDRFPGLRDRICEASYEKVLLAGEKSGQIGEGTTVVILLPRCDESLLRTALRTGAGRLCLIGGTAVDLTGVSREDLRRIALVDSRDGKGESPEQKALFLLAELTGGGERRDPPLVIVRGAGDLATGTMCKLRRCGFRVAALEQPHPRVIRRSISFAQALFDGTFSVEGTTAVRAESEEEMRQAWRSGQIPVILDPEGDWIGKLKPAAVVDAILAKKNLGTRMDMAPVVIALGPGFTAGRDVHAVIETNRGHNLGKIILAGEAEPNTHVPGNIAGYTSERVVHAPVRGRVSILRDIGSMVRKGEPILAVGDREVLSPLDGVVRGMIAQGTEVTPGFKIADVDPRGDITYCHIISDKARAIAGGVLESILVLNPGLLTGKP